jgi:hypothetical protein
VTAGSGGERQICHDDAAYVLGALSPADRRVYEEHLRECPACQASVRSLAGLPGLLALTTEDAVTGTQPVLPPALLPGLLHRAERARRRRGWLLSGLVAATAVLLVAVVWVIARPDDAQIAGPETGTGAPTGASATPSAVSDETVPLAQVMPGPMTATLELDDRRWGTAITVVCSYDEAMRNSVAYDLAVVDTNGTVTSAGSWSGVPGVTARVPVATSVPRDKISSFEIRLGDGRTILRGSP